MGHYENGGAADGALDTAEMTYLKNPKSALKSHRSQQSYYKRVWLVVEGVLKALERSVSSQAYWEVLAIKFLWVEKSHQAKWRHSQLPL